MPQIPQYEAPQGIGLHPSETGINATAGAARRLQGDYSEAAAAKSETGRRFGQDVEVAGDIGVKAIDHQQISEGAKTFAGMTAKKTQEWNDTVKNADPNDPTTAKKFIEENLEPALDEFKKGFITEKGQQYAEAHADSLREHMFHKTTADMATLAGEAAVVNTRQTINGLSNTVRSDPTSMDFALQTLETSTAGLVDSSPNLTGTAAAKVKTEVLQKGKEAIIKSAALGQIEKTGEVPDWVSDPKYSKYIDGAELKQLAQAAKYYERLGKSEERAARVQRDYESKVDFNTKINELEASVMPEKVGDRPTLPADAWDKVRELSQHPGAALDPGRLKSLVTQFDTITNRMNKPEPLTRVSNATEMGLIKRFRATDDSRLEPGEDATKAVYEEYDAGRLTTAGFRRMLNEANLRTPEERALAQDRKEFFKQTALAIDPSFGATAEGQQKTYFAEMDARRQEASLRKQGKDPHLVYDPRAPEYFGRPENLAKFKASLTDLMHGLQQEGGAAPAAGEGPARPRSKAERDALAPGTQYVAPDGSVRTRQ